MCVCSTHHCSNWFHGEDARGDGRAWKADKEKRPYITLYYTVHTYVGISTILYPHIPTYNTSCMYRYRRYTRVSLTTIYKLYGGEEEKKLINDCFCGITACSRVPIKCKMHIARVHYHLSFYTLYCVR